MPSNKDLIEEILKIDEEAVTDSLNNKQLGALLKKLKSDDVTPEPEVKSPAFSVKKGKAITSKRGILADGDEVKADDLAGGEDSLKALVESGHVVKA